MLISMSAENAGATADEFEKSLMPLFTGSEEAEKAGKL